MELPNVGKHCSFGNCKQLDFLPLQCKCGGIYCSEHFKLHLEECKSSKFITYDKLTKIQNLFVCSHNNCKTRCIVPLFCVNCNKHFCVKHRHFGECHEKDHATLAKENEYIEPLKTFTEAKVTVDKQLETTLNIVKNKTKKNTLASKILLMKLKNKATGIKTIPVPNRIYFNVTNLNGQLERVAPIFVSNQWSVGKTIDVIAEEMKLPNYNNKSNNKKLRLFKKDKQILSKDLSVILGTLLEKKCVVDGDSLIIEYVDIDCFELYL